MKLYKISMCWACCCTVIHAFLLGGYDYSAGNMYCLVDLWNPFSNMWLFFTLMLPCVGFTGHCYYKVYYGLRNLRSNTVASFRNRSISAEKAKKKMTKEEGWRIGCACC